MKKFVIAVSTLCFSTHIFAAQSLNTKFTGAYSSLRAMGMGNAFTAVADDYSLMFYNPAGFARKPYNEVQFSIIGAGVSAKTLTIMNDISKAADTPGTDNQKAQAISNALDKYYGQSLGGKLQALEMFWVRKGWGVGIIPMDLTIDMSVNRQLGPALDLNIRGDSTAAFGYGASYNKEIDWGVTAKYLHRVAVEQSLSTLELATDSNVLSDKRFKEGTSIDFDLGVMYTPDWFAKKSEVSAPPPTEVKPAPSEPEVKAEEKKPEEGKPEEKREPKAEGPAEVVKVPDDKSVAPDASNAVADQAVAPETKPEDKKPEEPKKDENVVGVVKLGDKPAEKKEMEVNQGPAYPLTLGLVVHNVLGGKFNQSKMINKNATDVPTAIERSIDVGSQYRLYDGESLKIRGMVDVQNILKSGLTLNNSLHIGAEFDYSPSGWFRTQFRAGLNQMYFTSGLTFLFGVVNLDFVTYGEEVGTESNKIENRVTAVKLGMNF